MNIIFIDSSSDILKLGFYNTCTEYFNEIQADKKDREHDYLIKTFQKLLYLVGIKISQIDIFICVTGPGSFTGVRMALSFINGLTSGLKLNNIQTKIVPLTLFQIYFLSKMNNLKSLYKSIVKIKSNRINTVFIQEFDNTTFNPISPAREININDINNNLNVIDESSEYNMKSVLQYVSSNLNQFVTEQNIIPCYIRPHYGIPKEYIINFDDSKNLKKITISNEEKQIGYVEYQTTDKTSEITDFQIEFAYRGIGAGKFLLKTFISKMKQQNCSKILLDVRSKNIIAQNLYKKFGFIIDGIRKNYYSKTNDHDCDDAILMSLILNN